MTELSAGLLYAVQTRAETGRGGSYGGAPLTSAERDVIRRLRRCGELPPFPRITSLEANALRDPDTGCLEWQRARNANGYGRVSRGGRLYLAHRLVLEAKLGRPISPGMFANHHCDNPPCIEAEHLYEGTAGENLADQYRRGHRP